MYLLDTDILSNLVLPVPSTALLVRLASAPAGGQFTSSISYGELVFGARKIGARGERILRALLDTVLPNIPILPFDRAAAESYGQIRAELERAGTPIGDAGTRIASIALARNFTVVTGNVRHFQRVPSLSVENWLRP